jgi:hypothetical protein
MKSDRKLFCFHCPFPSQSMNVRVRPLKLKVNFSQRRKLAFLGDRAAQKGNPSGTGERSQKPLSASNSEFLPSTGLKIAPIGMTADDDP